MAAIVVPFPSYPPRRQPAVRATAAPADRRVQSGAVSVFAPGEKVITRAGEMSAARIAPGTEVLTMNGYQTVQQVEEVPGRAVLQPQPDPEAAGPLGDPRKLMLVHGAPVELLSGLAMALLRVSDLPPHLLPTAPEAPSRGIVLRFHRPQIIITAQGSFASEDDAGWPPLLNREEAVLVFCQLMHPAGGLCDE